MLAGRLGIPIPLPRRWRKMHSMPSTIRRVWLPDCTSRFTNEKGAPAYRCSSFYANYRSGSVAMLLQLPGKEILRRAVRPNPALPHEERVNLIGEDEFLYVHFLAAQTLQKIHCLREIDIAIIVPLNEQHRRSPGRNRGIR